MSFEAVQADERGDDRPVGPRQPGRADLAAQDQDLVTEHQDLGVLGRLRSGEQGDPAENTKKRHLEQANDHHILPEIRLRNLRTADQAM
jgi:hypothetical protein